MRGTIRKEEGMSRRIDCTLTDAQWGVLLDAVCHYESYLEDDELEQYSVRKRRVARRVLERAWDRLAMSNNNNRNSEVK
jgi:hypothetical protein|tara:strand:- start:489 stop:725 length:237 start_codon:yes stop_codon:yes gene_type:complete